MSSGVPQEIIFVLNSFLVYINDLSQCTPCGHVYLFATLLTALETCFQDICTLEKAQIKTKFIFGSKLDYKHHLIKLKLTYFLELPDIIFLVTSLKSPPRFDIQKLWITLTLDHPDLVLLPSIHLS